MYDVLVYLFKNYFTPQSCPEHDILAKRLVAAGFEYQEVDDALVWLSGLTNTNKDYDGSHQAAINSLRVYTASEHLHLGSQAIGYLYFLQQKANLSPTLREIIITRVMDLKSDVSLSQFKIIALMVMWSHKLEIDHLMLEELLQEDEDRLLH